MSQILIGIYDEKRIVQEGICELLKGHDDIKVTLTSSKKPYYATSKF